MKKEENERGNWLTSVHLENGCLNGGGGNSNNNIHMSDTTQLPVLVIKNTVTQSQ